MIEDTGLHPITCITSLSQKDKQILLNQGIILCRDLLEDGRLLHALGLSVAKVSAVQKEISMICSS